MTTTPAAKALLVKLFASKDGAFIYGAEVRTAKAMPDLVEVEDNGYLRGNPERWFAKLTVAGKTEAAK